MCRLAMINQEGIKYIVENYGLQKLFDYLERQLGGHGNGYCFVYKNGDYCVTKGVSLSNEDIVNDILKEYDNIRWVIYHTRLASVGNINNNNCHPFECDGKVLAMNGTERNYTVVKKGLTDTENILLSSDNLLKDTKKYHSVFLGYEDGKVFATKNSGSLQYMDCANGGKIFASNFPLQYYYREDIYEAPQFFVEGNKINKQKLAKAYNRYTEYYSYILGAE